jgi:type VI protein secretion system component Hcp
MRKLNAILIITAGVVFAASSQSALAGKSTGKSSTNLYKSTVTGTHYKDATISARTTKSKGKVSHSDITIKKTTDKASP